jgi:sulfite exporter TauE/SafE
MEITLVLSALALGFFTGFHCLGMCGPIALSLGLSKKQQVNFYLQNTTYQFGRIFTYAVLGAILGVVGQAFELAGIQKYLTIAVGVLMIILALFTFGSPNFASNVPFFSKFLMKIKMNLGKLLRKTDYSSRFLTGILNGLLPCGMVYAALTASLAAGGIWQGAVFMAFFGLGTFPFMFAAVLFGNLLSASVRSKFLKAVPVLMIILGGLFVLRGLELDIPYISPPQESLHINTNPDVDPATCH